MAVGGTKGQANPLHPVGNKGERGGRGRHGYSALGMAEEGDDEEEGEGAHKRVAQGVADMDVDVDIEADVENPRHHTHQRIDSRDGLRAARGSNLTDSNIKSRGKSYALSVGKLLLAPPVERGRSDTTTSTNSATGLLAASGAYIHGCGAGAGAYGEYELGDTASGEYSPARRHSAAVPMDPACGSLVRAPSIDSLAVPPLPPLPLGQQHHHYNARHSGTALSSIVEVLPAALPADQQQQQQQQQQESDGSWEVVGQPASETDTGTGNSVLKGERETKGGGEVGVALEEEGEGEGDVVDATLFLLKALRRLHSNQRDEGSATIVPQSQSQLKSQDAAPIGGKKCINVHLRQTVEQLMQDYENHFSEERRYLIEKKVSFVVLKGSAVGAESIFR
jgi:hypothetical protein